jgi:hypothetical protein
MMPILSFCPLHSVLFAGLGFSIGTGVSARCGAGAAGILRVFPESGKVDPASL